MKNSTLYLFGKPKSAYQPHLTLLAKSRIQDANHLMKELAKQRDLVPRDEIKALIKRYQAVEEAKKWWEKILNEE